jgi:MFS family permease
MGAQESVMRAAVAELAPRERRGTAYGTFHLFFGVAWFGGSLVMGGLYEISARALVVFSITAQAIAVPLYLVAARRRRVAASQD